MQLRFLAAELGKVPAHLFFNIHDLLDLLDIILAGSGKGDGICTAVKNRGFDFLFHLFYHRTEPWLGYI